MNGPVTETLKQRTTEGRKEKEEKQELGTQSQAPEIPKQVIFIMIALKGAI